MKIIALFALTLGTIAIFIGSAVSEKDLGFAVSCLGFGIALLVLGCTVMMIEEIRKIKP